MFRAHRLRVCSMPSRADRAGPHRWARKRPAVTHRHATTTHLNCICHRSVFCSGVSEDTNGHQASVATRVATYMTTDSDIHRRRNVAVQ